MVEERRTVLQREMFLYCMQNVLCGRRDFFTLSAMYSDGPDGVGSHDKLAKVIHWDLCKKYGVKGQSKRYDDVTEQVEETDHVKILCEFNI